MPILFMIGRVISGFHLVGGSRNDVRRIATTMKAMGVQRVSATHCTGGAAEAVSREVFGNDSLEAGAGAVIEVRATTPDKPVGPADASAG